MTNLAAKVNYGQGLNYGHNVRLYKWDLETRELVEVYSSPEFDRRMGLFAIADRCRLIAARMGAHAYRLHRHGEPRGCQMIEVSLFDALNQVNS